MFAAETINAQSVIHPERQTEFTVVYSEPIEAGADNKRLVVGDVAGRIVSLVERPFDKDHIAAWTTFREAEMPVVPTLRTNGNTSLLVTDIKADGSEVYGKGLGRILTGMDHWARTRLRPDIDPLFVELTSDDNFSAVKAKAGELLAKANDNTLLLPYDDAFEMLVHPDGTWDLITLDLQFAKSHEYNELSQAQRNKLYRLNNMYVDQTVISLRALHKRLKRLQPRKKRSWLNPFGHNQPHS